MSVQSEGRESVLGCVVRTHRSTSFAGKSCWREKECVVRTHRSTSLACKSSWRSYLNLRRRTYGKDTKSFDDIIVHSLIGRRFGTVEFHFPARIGFSIILNSFLFHCPVGDDFRMISLPSYCDIYMTITIFFLLYRISAWDLHRARISIACVSSRSYWVCAPCHHVNCTYM